MAKLALYEDQIEVLQQLRDGFKAGHRIQLLYAPTGAGKTEMAMALMQATAAKENRAAMTLDRIVLCNQTSARLDKYGIDHGVLQAGHWRFRPHERIQVCSAQTLEKRGDFPNLTLLIIDECHDQRQMTLEFLKSNPKIKAIGLSASPFTKGLATTYTNVVSATTTAKLVNQGRLVPLRVFIAKQINMKGAKKVAGEFAQNDIEKRGKEIIGDIAGEWEAKTAQLFGGPAKTIVFCSNVAHGASLAEEFAARGHNFVPISYLSDDEFKKDSIAEFAKPDSTIMGLIACDILTKGFDVPDVKVGISARPFAKSFSQHVQQMGRVMRASPDKGFALWLDHSGNYLRFQEQWDELYEHGVRKLKDEGEKAPKEPTDKEVEERRCPKCSALWPGRAEVCPSCGYVKLRLNMIENVAGEMVELDEEGKAPQKFSREMKQAWWSQILTWGDDRNWRPGACSHRYRAKFGVWPKGLDDVRAPLTQEVASWLRGQQIRWAKGNKGNKRSSAPGGLL